jgi:transcriptional regulator with XRE-family HTH domain
LQFGIKFDLLVKGKFFPNNKLLSILKKSSEHIGDKIKRFRGFRGMTQGQLALAIGKTRSLVSYFERTGIINKYTFKEIAEVLHTTTEELENLEDEVLKLKETASEVKQNNENFIEKLLEQQKSEINFLKQTITQQWELIQRLKII